MTRFLRFIIIKSIMDRKIRLKQRKHSLKRLKQRYNTDFKREDIKNIIDLILNHEAKRIPDLEKHKNNQTLYLVKYNDNDLVVSYDKKQKEIATFLPLDCVEYKDFKTNINQINDLLMNYCSWIYKEDIFG